MAELKVRESVIPGLYIINLALHRDQRGWFKESYQKEKLEALGLPKFEIVQNNFSFNNDAGTTRGLHAEPWDKYISVANGRVFGAWVDLRKGDTFGKVFSLEMSTGIAIFVPRGVANGYQTLDDGITYTYLVNQHWYADAKYSAVNLFDPSLGIEWPFRQDEALVSDKDKSNPMIKDIEVMEI